MSTTAQDEVDRLFSQDHSRLRAHPEDADQSDGLSSDEKDVSDTPYAAPAEEDTDDEEINYKMSSLSTTKPNYVLPTIAQYANTGPKGVIADAQSFVRAKRDAIKVPKTNTTSAAFSNTTTNTGRTRSDSEEEEFEDEDDDEAFMAQWRANRLAELAAGTDTKNNLSAKNSHERRVSPSRRTYGNAVYVDAAGYLDAIEKVSSDTTVVVMIYDHDSEQSLELEDEIDILAYKYGYVRFIKLDHEVAEMEHVQIPALLAYRGGDLYATISGAQREGLEQVLIKEGVLR